MSSGTVSGVTGEGHSILDLTFGTSWIPVHEIEVHLTAIVGKTRIIGTTAVPRNVRYAGHIGLGIFDDGPDWDGPPYSMMEWMINREEGSLWVPHAQNTTIYFQSLYWRLAPGVTADITWWWGS